MVVGGLVFVMACGGSQDKPDTPKPEPEPMADAPEPEPEPEPAEPEDSSPPERVSEMGDRPPPVPESWEPKMRHCEELAEKYEELLLADEMEKLEKRKLAEKHRPSAEKNVRNAAKKGADNWLQACKDIVGTVQHKPRWDCALQASSIERFNGCMDGKYDAD